MLRVQIPNAHPSLAIDFPELRIGCAEYPEGPTGVTVFHFASRVFGAVDCRGASPATSLTDVLRMNYGRFVNAIVFSGGSAYGLEAASGVAARLLSSGQASARWDGIAIVPGAVVFDFRGRSNSIHPDHSLGAAALDAAREGIFPLGPYGAGRFVHCGKLAGEEFMERAGQGAAFRQYGSTKLAVFTVVNAVGCIVDRSGAVVRGNRDASGVRLGLEEIRRLGRRNPTPSVEDQERGGNTTLTLVVTNRDMTQAELQALAVQTHTSMARAIQPFHTTRDGDTLFAVTTGDDRSAYPTLGDLYLEACDLAWTAVLNCAAAGSS